ncbi:hypothetical protein AB0I10_39115 [Streptomyces sp. NPDC050636]|uniref:hypothetical protein n=1 Tax=Streptomyces sp. NPDC050636 TaxID=3154510 RepID=UPI003422F64E
MATVDAPTLRLEALSPWQMRGTSCCWCSYTADARFPVALLREAGARLHACETCVGVYGIPAVEVAQ